MHCDSYIKVLAVPQAQMMFGHRGVNIKMVNCPDCGKEFNRKFNMEHHRIVIHGYSNSQADTEESFDRFDQGTEASDEHDSSNEQESIAEEGDNDDDDDDDSDEDEDEGDDDNSNSDSQSSTADEDDDDSVWSGIRELSWMSELVDTFDGKKPELVEGGMSASDAHQAAYRCVLPKLRWNITTNYMKKILETASFVKTLSIEKSWPPNKNYKKMMIMNMKRPWGMRLKVKISYTKSNWHPEWWWTRGGGGWRWRKWMNLNPRKNEWIEPQGLKRNSQWQRRWLHIYFQPPSWMTSFRLHVCILPIFASHLIWKDGRFSPIRVEREEDNPKNSMSRNYGRDVQKSGRGGA